MLRAMFGMGGTEILVILIVALLFLGPDKLPDAAKKISKGIRDIKKQSRALQQTIEDDENIGGALRDLRSALRGEDAPPPRPKPPKQIEAADTLDPAAPATALIAAADAPANAETAASEAAASEAAASEAAASEAAASEAAVSEAAVSEAAVSEAAATPSAVEPPIARDPLDADAEVASAFAFESGHMTTPVPTPARAHEPAVPRITLPPTAGEPSDATASPPVDAELAGLVKPAPNTIARGSTVNTASGAASGAASVGATGAAESSEPEHG
jgi:sec-independent protein translocase protein TatB